MSNHPIGIFDSGIGGTSIFKEIHALLPLENIIYLADSANAPYGNKSREDILQLSVKNTELLIDRGCKLIVVACNTATTNAIAYLRQNYNIPFIGIEPAIKPASLNSRSKSIGILATKGTLSSALFHKTSDLYAKDVKVIEQVGEGLVPLIEAGQLHSQDIRDLLKKFTLPMIKAEIDYLVLGCTHYPYLIPELKKILPSHVTIIDSGLAVAKQTETVLRTKQILNNEASTPKIEFYSNGDISILKKILNNQFPVSYLNF
ncbi:glutamate racemase [Winogradskyella wandonensis]|uniref:Glutamate racemase n=1 Tax=Winogradskyella wandonensis TaxID=1442586 RepID=A0A4R1KTI9_9FLAO|nr:glutamate racemase [Winogradskyella wandonensis]TCK67539.1 glutamate racemase [Winogradskyella wandonensis]